MAIDKNTKIKEGNSTTQTNIENENFINVLHFV